MDQPKHRVLEQMGALAEQWLMPPSARWNLPWSVACCGSVLKSYAKAQHKGEHRFGEFWLVISAVLVTRVRVPVPAGNKIRTF